MGNCVLDVQRRPARRSLDLTNQEPKKSPLTFNIRSWPKYSFVNLTKTQNYIQRKMDSNLYDGEKLQITMRSFPCSSGFLANIPGENLNFNLRSIIQKKSKSYTINFPQKEEKIQIWRFIRRWTEFQLEDVMRLGRTQYRLCKLVHSDSQRKIQSCNSLDLIPSRTNIEPENNNYICRICLSTKESESNPLISPCKCTGSVKYTHLKCLSKWMFSLSVNESQYINIRVDKSICELCKTDITDTPQYNKMADLLLANLHEIPAPYAILQNRYQKGETLSNNYFILCFKKKLAYTFGRSSKADICDKNDQCISKINSELKYNNNQLFVKDCESLHGTLIRLKESLRLDVNNLSQDIIYNNMLIKAVYNPDQDNDF